MSRCRTCRTPKWNTDPCANANCQRNLSAPTTVRRVKTTTASRIATQVYGAGVDRFFDGLPKLRGRTYVADFDGTSYLV